MVRGVCHQGRYDAIKGAQRTAALLHEPSDSRLLWDAVRVMVRLVKAADALIGGRLVWRNHWRAAKKRARVIEYARDRPTGSSIIVS